MNVNQFVLTNYGIIYTHTLKNYSMEMLPNPNT